MTKTKRYPVMRKLPASFTRLINDLAAKPQPVFEEVEVCEHQNVAGECALCAVEQREKWLAMANGKDDD